MYRLIEKTRIYSSNASCGPKTALFRGRIFTLPTRLRAKYNLQRTRNLLKSLLRALLRAAYWAGPTPLSASDSTVSSGVALGSSVSSS